METVEGMLETAVSHHQAGRLDKAASGYEDVLRQDPNQPDAIHLLGVIAHQLGRCEVALDHLRRAVALRPDAAPFQEDLAVVCLADGRLDEAIGWYRQAAKLQPDRPEAHNTLGCLLAKVGNWEEAAASFRRVLELAPNHAQAHNNLGNVLFSLERPEEAIASYEKAMELAPAYPDACNNLGVALRAVERPDEAIAAFRRALELRPGWDEARANLASTFVTQEKLSEAAACYDAMNPARPVGRLGGLHRAALWPSVVDSRAEMDAARKRLLDYLNWLRDDATPLSVEELAAADCRPPFNLQFDHENVRPIREAYASWYARHVPEVAPPRRSRQETQRGRVGFVMTDRFETAFLKAVGGILARMNTDRIELIVFCRSVARERIERAISREAVRVVPLDPPLRRTAETIRQAGCDVLYYREIGLDSLGYCLPLMRLASVQCTSVGMQITSGMSRVDYYLSSAVVEPADAAEHYTEKLVLADTLLTWRRRAKLPDRMKTRDAFGFHASDHLYVCAQIPSKFHPDFDPMLADILRADGRGKIVTTADPHGYRADRLCRRWARTMPDVADRIVVLPRLDTDDYLCLLAAADVLLDPPHFGGLNSTYDAFSLGRAIVASEGPFRRGRFTAGCYRKMGLEDLIARDADDYVRRAVRLGVDADHRREVETRIGQASHVLFEDDAAVAEHERIFKQLVRESRQ